MEVINNILQAREEKSNLIKQYINDYQIITLKANIVGENKNIREAYILLSYFFYLSILLRRRDTEPLAKEGFVSFSIVNP